MDDVNTLLSFKKLAEDEENSFVLLEDKTSLQGLVLLLSNEDKDIVSVVLQIFSILSDKPGALSVLSTLLGLDQQLANLIAAYDSSTSEREQSILCLARSLRQALSKIRVEKSSGQQPFSPTFRPRNVVLRLYGVLSENDLEAVRERLLRVRGVVSITFQLSKRRAIVCTVPDLDPEWLVRAIRSVGNTQPLVPAEPNAHPASDANTPVEESFRARIVRKRSQLTRTGSIYRSKRRVHPILKPDSSSLEGAPVYLDADADLFEVDETRAAPKLKSASDWDKQDSTGQGPIDWLSNFLQRSFYW